MAARAAAREDEMANRDADGPNPRTSTYDEVTREIQKDMLRRRKGAEAAAAAKKGRR